MPSRGSFESFSPAFLQLFLVVAFLLCWCAWSSIWALSGLESEFILCAHMEKLWNCIAHRLICSAYAAALGWCSQEKFRCFHFFPHICTYKAARYGVRGKWRKPTEEHERKIVSEKRNFKNVQFLVVVIVLCPGEWSKGEQESEKKKQFPSFVSRYQQFFFVVAPT